MQVQSAGAFDMLSLAPSVPTTPTASKSADATSVAEASSLAAQFSAILNAVIAPALTSAVVPNDQAASETTPEGEATGNAPADGSASVATTTIPTTASVASAPLVDVPVRDDVTALASQTVDALRFGMMTGDARADVRATDNLATPTPRVGRSVARVTRRETGPQPTGTKTAATASDVTDANTATKTTDEPTPIARGARRTAVAKTSIDDQPVSTKVVDDAPASPTSNGTIDVAALGMTTVIDPALVAIAKPATTTAPAATTPSASSSSSSSTLDTVDADLRAKLTRVVDRMRDEYGHDVDVVEGFRTQERQDWLYEQGRTRGGSVVTWTHASQHTQGRAVDVSIDGGFTDATAFAELQQVAREEGLHTLGARDPGHLELPRDGAAPSNVKVTSLASTLRTVPNAMPNGAAPNVTVETPVPRAAATRGNPNVVPAVALVAQVANVAEVATVAQIAQPGVERPVAAASRGAVSAVASRVSSPTAKSRRDNDSASSGGQPHRGATAYAAAATQANVADATQPPTTAAAPITRVQAPLPAAGASALARVTQALDARENAAPGSMSEITLRVDNAAGGQDQIRVGLRGADVGTSINLGDGASVDRMRASVSDLRDALGRHGLTADTVQISSAARSADVVDTSRAMAAATIGAVRAEQANGGSNSGASQQQSREQSQQQARDAQRDAQSDASRDGGRRSRRDAQDTDEQTDSRPRSRRGAR